MTLAAELAKKYGYSHYVPGEDGYGGEDVPEKKFVAAINEVVERCTADCTGMASKFVVCGELYGDTRVYCEKCTRILSLLSGGE